MSTSSETARIEDNVEQARARLDATLGALQDKMSPGQFLDQGLSYLRDSGGGDFGRNLGASMQANPLPVALVGIGLAWMMLAPKDRGRPAPYYTQDSSIHFGRTSDSDGVYAKAQAAASSISRTAGETAEAFQERVSDARAAAMGVTRDVGETVQAFTSRVDGMMKSGADKAREAGADAREAVSDAAESLRNTGMRTFDYLQQQPMLLGALGVTVGALLAAALPRTEAENEMMGEWRDRVGDTVKEAGAAAMEKGAGVVNEALDAASSAAGKVREAVEKTAEAGHQAMTNATRPQDEDGSLENLGNGVPPATRQQTDAAQSFQR